MENKVTEQPLTLANAFRADLTLSQIFDNLIEIGKQGFRRDKKLMTMAFLILRDCKNNKWKTIVVPMPAFKAEDTQMNAIALKRLVEDLKKNSTEDIKLMAVVKGTDAHMSEEDSDKIINPDGSINQENFIPPRLNKNSKDVLLFELEESVVKHTKVFEYILSDDGDVVLNDTPYIDHRSAYDAQEDKNSNLSFVFTHGQEAES